ncbi:FMN-binding glutamate synthase family protein [Falsarthrobacter nasiphocae]|uniref:Glutamate synthase domain-containing protein 2 n=1 Tax=Falsarthrobacter nasiphocae TaxID=189863 RepID=A0AAE4C6X5_9MICC|nr:FMN-binding glutamate synthase family protein [Falsarthrobacter nasiphocae]MDR6892627.1 glutamate synthase domain-containing protein 2 [Falsarthrobacter nasiphocae]
MKKRAVWTGITSSVGAGLGGLAIWDLVQKKHAILRNYPVVGHARFALEAIRPEIQQYFIERNWDGRPFDRDTRSTVYARSKGEEGTQPFGTERDVLEEGYEYLAHSIVPVPQAEEPPRVRIGGPDCTQPYDMALMNVSAMSFGSLSANAIRALNKGAAIGGFAHDTGEGGISTYHLENGGDLVWEIGSGYFGCRTATGDFDPEAFREKSRQSAVKMVSLKLSQGAKPGLGGVLPGPKVTEEIAAIRGVPVGETVVSPPYHRVFSTPKELIEFIATMRELSGGKPAGFKMCVSSRLEVLALCKAMVELGVTPDFVIVDGSEGGTGAAPLEFEDHVGMPLTEGLMMWHNALIGAGLRDRVKIGASGKVAVSSDIVKRIIQGADFTNSARTMMMAVGCIQAQACDTGKCPTGVATQDKRRQRAIDVPDKSHRVAAYQRTTVRQAMSMMAAMGVDRPEDLRPWMLRRVVAPGVSRSYAELYEWLSPRSLVEGTDPRNEDEAAWKRDWDLVSAESFRVDGERT